MELDNKWVDNTAPTTNPSPIFNDFVIGIKINKKIPKTTGLFPKIIYNANERNIEMCIRDSYMTY